MNKKLKPLTIFLSDDELINFKSHFDEFLNMNCDDKIKEQQEEIERLNNKIQDLQADYGNKAQVERDLLKEENKRLNNIIKEQDKEIKLERKTKQRFIDSLAKVCELVSKRDKEIERLNNIIKDVRGYIERLRKDDEYTAHLEFTYGDRDNIFRILDKADKGE